MMSRLEILHLRMAGDDLPGLAEEIRRAVAGERDLLSLRIWRHATIADDLGIHLFVEAVDAPDSQSNLGLRLAAALREHGMVEHTVWLLEESDQ